MTEQEVLNAIKDGDTAYMILRQSNPGFERRFRRLCSGIVKLMEDINHHFPDAQYYTGGEGGLSIMLGSPHDESTNDLLPQQQLMAVYYGNINIGDGAW